MSVLKRLGAGLALGAIALAAGCKLDNELALGDEGKFDTKALDVYMADRDAHAPQLQTVANAQPTNTDVTELPAQPGQVIEPPTGVYGHWVAKIDVQKEMEKERANMKADPNATPEQQKAAEEFSKAMAEALGAMMQFDLTLNQDNTFAMTMMAMPMKGTWRQDGDVIALNVSEVLGMKAADFAKKNGGKEDPSKEPLFLKVSPDGQSLVAFDPKHNGNEEFVFKRA